MQLFAETSTSQYTHEKWTCQCQFCAKSSYSVAGPAISAEVGSELDARRKHGCTKHHTLTRVIPVCLEVLALPIFGDRTNPAPVVDEWDRTCGASRGYDESKARRMKLVLQLFSWLAELLAWAIIGLSAIELVISGSYEAGLDESWYWLWSAALATAVLAAFTRWIQASDEALPTQWVTLRKAQPLSLLLLSSALAWMVWTHSDADGQFFSGRRIGSLFVFSLLIVIDRMSSPLRKLRRTEAGSRWDSVGWNHAALALSPLVPAAVLALFARQRRCVT